MLIGSFVKNNKVFFVGLLYICLTQFSVEIGISGGGGGGGGGSLFVSITLIRHTCRQHSSSLGQLPHQNNHSTPPHRDSARSHDHRGKDTDPRRSIDASQLVGTDSSPPPLIPPRDLLREEQEDSFYMNVNH